MARQFCSCSPSSATLLTMALTLFVPIQANAFTLGDIRVNSALGEPFMADLPLSMDEEEAKDLEIAIANPSEYQVMELDRPPIVANLTVTMTGGQTKERRIVIRGSSPVREPFFNLLLKSTIGRGSHFRAYRVFLDLPAKSDKPTTVDAAPTIAKQAKPTLVGATHYGPVQPRETLTHVARKVGSANNIPVHQVMVAIWSANKSKFIDENIFGLSKGVVLDLPNAEEMRRVNDAEAKELLKSQQKAWSKRAEKSVPPPAKKKQTPPESTNIPKVPDAEAKQTVASVVKESEPKVACPPTPPAPDLEISQKLTEAQQQLKTLTPRLDESNQRLLKAEAERNQLQQRLSELSKQLETIEQAKLNTSQVEWNGPLLGAGAGVIGLLTGIMIWWQRRKKSKPKQPDQEVAIDLQEDDSVTVKAPVTLSKTPVLAPSPNKMIPDNNDDNDDDDVQLAGPISMESQPAPRSSQFVGVDLTETETVVATHSIAGHKTSLGQAGAKPVTDSGPGSDWNEKTVVATHSITGQKTSLGQAGAKPVAESGPGSDLDEASDEPFPGGLEIGGESDGDMNLEPFAGLEFDSDLDEVSEEPSFGGIEIDGDLDDEVEVKPFESFDIGNDQDDNPDAAMEVLPFSTQEIGDAQEIGDDLSEGFEEMPLGGLNLGGDLDEVFEVRPFEGIEIGMDAVKETLAPASRQDPEELEDLEIIAFSHEETPKPTPPVAQRPSSKPPEEMEIIEFDFDLENDEPKSFNPQNGDVLSRKPGSLESDEKELPAPVRLDQEMVLEFDEDLSEKNRQG